MKKKFTATLALALTLVLCVAFGGGVQSSSFE